MIIQKSLDGKVIAEYNTKTQAAKALSLDESAVRKAIKFNRTVLGKYKFSYSDGISAKVVPVLQSPAKILLLDIETLPLLVLVYQKQVWKARIGHDKVLADWIMVTWAAKWLNEDDVLSDRLDSTEIYHEDDSRIVKSLWTLLDEADIVIAHNIPFDVPNINTRSIKHGLLPPSPFKTIDTLKVAQNQFGFTHNGLDALANFFDLEGKTPTTFELWKSCLFGDSEALEEMETYNIQDVLVLEKVYLKLRPYIVGHSNLDLYIDSSTPVCTHCGSQHIKKQEGKYFYTQAVRYETFRCDDCGAISRAKQGLKYINKKQISAIPR